MSRPSKPWFRAARQEWYVTIDGRPHRLGPDKDEAHRRFHLLMAERGVAVPEGQVFEFLTPVFQQFVFWAMDNLAERTLTGYFGFLDAFDRRWPNILISELKPHHLQQWLDEQSWGPTRKRQAAIAIVRALNWAVKQGRIAVNPLRGFTKPRAVSRTTVVAEEDFDALLDLVRDQEFRDLLIVAYDSGARPQELRILEARHIREGMAVIPGAEAKGGRTRAIYFPTDRSREITDRLSTAHPDGPVFRNLRGGQWTAFSINNRFARLAKKAGKKFRLYDFRHGFITRALKSGVDSHTVALLAGHADTKMLDSVYSHINADHDYMRRQAERASVSGRGPTSEEPGPAEGSQPGTHPHPPAET